jgi:uncharacterized repeat protein (TIGR02543 family)
MKKTVMYIVAAAALAVITVIAIIGCNDGVGGDNDKLNNFIGSFVGGGNGGGEHTHTWGEWTEIASATCEAPGLETRTCTQNADHHESRETQRLTGEVCDKTYSVTVSNGSADPNNCKAGTAVTITAGNAPPNQEFITWTTESSNVIFAGAANSTTTFIMPAHDVSVTALFGEKNIPLPTYTLTVKSNSGGNASADKTTDITAGTPVNISAAPASGYKFVNWTVEGGGTVADPNNKSTTVTVNGDVTVTATFTPDNPNTTPTPTTYTLTVNSNAGGSASGGKSGITAGTQVNISATAADNYTFTNWTISGNGTIANATSAATTVTVNGNVTVTANFNKNSDPPTPPPPLSGDIMLDDFEDRDNVNALGGIWYFYTYLTMSAKSANPTGCYNKTFTPYITDEKVERITNAQGNGVTLTFKDGGYGSDVTPPKYGSYSGVMKFENLDMPWNSDVNENSWPDVYPGVGMGTMLTLDTLNGVGNTFKSVTAISFWMKVSSNVKSVGFKIETADQLPQNSNNWKDGSIYEPNIKKGCPADASYEVHLDGELFDAPSTTWKQYTIPINKLTRADWEIGYKPYTFNITRAIKIAWFVDQANGTPIPSGGMVAIDNVEIINYNK